MRPSKISFLFFCTLFLLCIIDAFSQQNIDSTKYYRSLVDNPKTIEDLTNAFKYYESLQKDYQKQNNILGEVFTLTNIAQIEKKNGSIYESEKSAIDALTLLDSKHSNDSSVVEYYLSLYNHLGKIYREYEDYDNALLYYDFASKKTNDSKGLATIWNNVGYSYSEQGIYKLAIENFQKAYTESVKIKDTIQSARALDNLGVTQSKINHPNALTNLELALELKKQLGHTVGIFTSYLHLGEYYKDRNKNKMASYYVNKALEMARSTNNSELKMAALEMSLDLKDYNNYEEFKNLRDSSNTFKSASQNKYAKLKYDKTNEVERANLSELKFKTSELQKEKQKRSKLLFQTVAAFILLISLFSYFIIKSKHKKEKIKEVYLTETRFSKKVHDELANDISDSINFVENSNEIPKEKKVILLNSLEDIYLRTRDISTKTASIDLVNFSESLKYLLMQHNRQGTKVIINDIDTIDWLKVPDHKKMVIYRCLQELMVNMKKHSQAKVVSIVFKTNGNVNYIRYTDDGIGSSLNEMKINGLRNVESRIKSIGGTFSFDTSKGNGFKTILKFKS